MRRTAEEIAKMRRAGRVVAEMHEATREAAKPGVTTLELDAVARDVLERRDAKSNFLHYRGYPAVICTSPNDMIVHGIPGDYRAAEGDIISFDIGVTKDGMIADSASTFPVGEIAPEAQRLLDVCRAALEAGIDAAQLHAAVGDISAAVQGLVEEAGFAVVRSLVGHGVGRAYHEDPQVPNFVVPYRGPELVEGMTIAIEPMITAGDPEVYIHDDEWSISTVDGSLAAHFEHTVAITAEGPRVLTRAAPVLVG
jgi:methionyl aminopeptidase